MCVWCGVVCDVYVYGVEWCVVCVNRYKHVCGESVVCLVCVGGYVTVYGVFVYVLWEDV